MTDHNATIITLVENYITIERDISGQKNEQRSIRRAINALGGLGTLTLAKADFHKPAPKPAPKK